MKMLSAALRRFRLLAGGGSSTELNGNRVVIGLVDPRPLRLVGRMVLLAVAIISLPWLGTGIFGRVDGSHGVFDRPSAVISNNGDEFLRVLLDDMRSRGLINLENDLVVLRDPISNNDDLAFPDGAADFVFSAVADGFDRIDRILKQGGFVALPLSTKLQPPANYRTAYVGHIGSATVIAMKKYATTAGGRRRLLAVPEAKKEALNGLEDVLLEPPRRPPSRRQWRKTRYLPELTGDTLDGYPRRVFMEVVPAWRQRRQGDVSGSAAAWFERHYPKKDRAFEVMQLVVVEEKEGSKPSSTSSSTTFSSSSSSSSPSSRKLSSPAEWLESNVSEEDYVVLKAEAEVVEEMLAKGAVRLVDELFLECRHQWGKKKKERGRRAYWECLALYGKLRDEGVAVHQWWGS